MIAKVHLSLLACRCTRHAAPAPTAMPFLQVWTAFLLKLLPKINCSPLKFFFVTKLKFSYKNKDKTVTISISPMFFLIDLWDLSLDILIQSHLLLSTLVCLLQVLNSSISLCWPHLLSHQCQLKITLLICIYILLGFKSITGNVKGAHILLLWLHSHLVLVWEDPLHNGVCR